MQDYTIDILRKQTDNLIYRVSQLERKLSNLQARFEGDQRDLWAYIQALETKVDRK